MIYSIKSLYTLYVWICVCLMVSNGYRCNLVIKCTFLFVMLFIYFIIIQYCPFSLSLFFKFVKVVWRWLHVEMFKLKGLLLQIKEINYMLSFLLPFIPLRGWGGGISDTMILAGNCGIMVLTGKTFCGGPPNLFY